MAKKKYDDYEELRDEEVHRLPAVPFQPGNVMWKKRSVHGRGLLFSLPDLLIQAKNEYLATLTVGPFMRQEVIKSGEWAGQVVTLPMITPPSIAGFCVFAHASPSWWRNFKRNPSLSQEFLTVIEEIENEFATWQWEGATMGVFKENIIARTLGLGEKTDLTTNGQPLNARLDLNALSEDDLRNIIALQTKARQLPDADKH